MDLEQIIRRVRRGYLIRVTVGREKRRSSCVEPSVLITQLNHHRLINGPRERNQATRLIRVFRRSYKPKPGAILYRPLRKNQKVFTKREPRLILLIVKPPVH